VVGCYISVTQLTLMKFLPSLILLVTVVGLNSCGLSGSLGSVKEKLPGMPKMPKIAMPKMPSMPKIAMPSMPKMPKIAMPKMPEMKRGDIARFSFSDLLPSRVPVVEVRESELRELQLGKEKALAYQRQGGFFNTWFGKPVDFKEPELPSGALDNPEFGLLPPKSE